MGKLDRYIGSSVFMAILAVLGIILGLASLFAFIDEMGSISDSYTVMDVFSFVLLTAPRRMYEMLPMAALIRSKSSGNVSRLRSSTVTAGPAGSAPLRI